MPSLTGNGSQISVSDTVPPKFQAVCERESRFYRQRQEKARTDIADAGIGIDISDPALEVARRNCELHSMQDRAIFLTGCFGSFALDPLVMAQGPFDFIACNPPYISDRKANRMRATIGHEPQLALIAEDGGYQAYRDICKSLEANLSILRTGGSLGFEIGKDMAGGVRRIFSRWKETGAFEDQHGFLRVIVFQRPASV
ncbi:hypothetical protein H4217_000962 [Coemansia sp. RSA 1939]|nr:hypothetical protein H4217_000962 [Coemansia sp. RSA 1939]